MKSIICTAPDTFYQYPGPVFGAGAVFRNIALAPDQTIAQMWSNGARGGDNDDDYDDGCVSVVSVVTSDRPLLAPVTNIT